MFTFSLLKNVIKEKFPWGIKDEKASYSFCYVKL